MTSISDLVGASSITDWTENFAAKKGIFILDSASVTKTGNITLKNVSFINSCLTVAQNLSINNGSGTLTLTNNTLNATAGTVNLTGGNVTANHIVLSAETGGLNQNGTTLNTTEHSGVKGNITLIGNKNLPW
ncbi:hypothetical protein DLN99_23290 [Salmonella enterica]|nr:hypothetical protein [Salmonella enterica]